MSSRDVTRRMVDHPRSATGPLISLPVDGFRPMKLHAGSCISIMSNSVVLLFSSWMVACFFRWMLIWAIFIGRVIIGDRSFIVGPLCWRWSAVGCDCYDDLLGVRLG